MMHECKRILNKQVAGEGLWQTDLLKCQGQQKGEVLEIHGPMVLQSILMVKRVPTILTIMKR